jgi:hypothetical protein
MASRSEGKARGVRPFSGATAVRQFVTVESKLIFWTALCVVKSASPIPVPPDFVDDDGRSGYILVLAKGGRFDRSDAVDYVQAVDHLPEDGVAESGGGLVFLVQKGVVHRIDKEL